MKYFWVLFSLFLMTLSVLPCNDSIECRNSAKTEVSQNTTHQSHNHTSEQCPPFCSCACCGFQMHKLQTASFSFKKTPACFVQKKALGFYTFQYHKKIVLDIWQPPKINA